MKTTAPLLVASLLSALSATGQDTIPITVYGGSTDFENIEMSDVFFSGNVGQSSIESDASVSASIPAANRPMNFTYAETREKVLCVDTAQDAPLFRNLNQDAGSANVGYPIYADFLIKGAAHKKDDVVLPTSPEDKILVYFRETEENGVIVGTNLYVRAAAYECDFDEAVPDGWEYKLETPAPGIASFLSPSRTWAGWARVSRCIWAAMEKRTVASVPACGGETLWDTLMTSRNSATGSFP